MSRDDIIKLAREAGLVNSTFNSTEFWCRERNLERFAALVEAAEREACANINFRALIGLSGQQCYEISEAIRARGQS